MKILDKLKKEEDPSVKKKTEKKVEKPKKEVEEKKTKSKEKKPVKKLKVSVWRTLKEPHITEKATDLNKEDKYVFKVWPKANKTEIKKAIEELYGVDVLSVNILRVHPKQRRLGRTRGFRKGYKKAVVKVKKGQKIELLPR